ncbi:hypothetical protein BT69DRAFT_1279158 [Atractiella rhizophila]|nr:hypothetical protein BT69DRAFT_1279158 [Atractiella rhizophila]
MEGLTSPFFLSIPLDVRLLVYSELLDNALLLPTVSSSNPSTDHLGSPEMLPPCGDGESFERSGCVFYPRLPLFSTTVSLQLVCKQINEELKSFTAFRPACFNLDLAVVNDETIYLTWLSLPPPLPSSAIIQHVQVNFRCVGDSRVGDSPWGSLFKGGDGGPAAVAWEFLAIINRFLRRGPGFTCPARNAPLLVKKITFNLRSTNPSPVDSAGKVDRRVVNRAFLQGLRNVDGTFNADAALMLFSGLFARTLNETRGYHGRVSMSHAIYEKLERMEFVLDGRIERCFDIRAIKGKRDSNGSV